MAILLVAMIVILIAADQLIKLWAVKSLEPVESMDFIRFGDFEIFDLTYLENKGAIFGSMAGQRWFLVGFTSLVILAGIFVLFRYMKRSKLLSTAIALFIAGGIGNLIDRIRFGYVVDMFELKLFKFAIFNFADICVTFAFVMILIYAIFIDPKIEKKLKAEKEAAKEVASDE
ncbi:MAG: signal peptidase II [Ruminococcus sp.]|nr:signal peptidase II [Ruminococcus sp.]